MNKAQSASKLTVFILLAVLIILLLSLFNLQIIQGEKYALIAEKNYLRIKQIIPNRGEIYDRNYLPIATNTPSINLYINPGKIIDRTEVAKFISEQFSIEFSKIQKIIFQNRFRLYNEILLVQDVNLQQVIEVSEKFDQYPSLDFKTENKRKYAYNNHFTGFVSKISEKEYDNKKNLGYSINSLIGKTGLEKEYESRLRGKNGYSILQVDASGNSLKFFKHNLHQEPENGADMILTLDNELQAYLSEIMPEDIPGAAVVMNVKTGGILAYVSKPDYDQNIFIGNLSSENWNKLLNDPNKPMLDRIIHGTYPPGSVFKTIPAMLGLKKKILEKDTKLKSCDGGMQVGNRYFKCWYPQGHGKVNVVDALKYSCDVFFYDLSLQLSLDEYREYTKENFLTTKTGIDLPGERNGFFPTTEWYVKNYGKYVNILGQKINLSIGQGELLVTPLQICAHYSAIASNGIWRQPHLLKKFIRDEKEEIIPHKELRLPSSKYGMEIIQEALYKTVNGRYGTGTAASLLNISVYGKTGSAENHMGKTTHAWFAGYASWEEPEISYCIFLQNGGHGGSATAPIAKKIIQFYDQQKKKKLSLDKL